MSRWMLLTLAWSSPAWATTVVHFDMATHVAASDAVIEATVRGAEVRVDKATGRPWTWTRLEVHDVLQGEAPTEILLEQPGGLGPDGRMHKVAGDAVLEDGERVVLFLAEDEGAWHLVLWGWSVWHVEDKAVWRDVGGLTVLDGPELRPLDYTPDAYVDTLSDLRAAIAEAGAR